MADRKRPRVQTGLRLDPAILKRLRNSERGLSDEIRDRLERTFKEDALDPVTREVRDQFVLIADLLRQDYGTDWHKSYRAQRALTAAIELVLADYAPSLDSPAVSALFGPDEPPETIGRMRARDVQRRQSYPHLEAAQKRKHARAFSRAMRGKKEGKHD